MKHVTLMGVAAVAIAAAAPAQAQDQTVTKRVDRLEKEMRAVQRQVFPGGAPTFFEGEIAPDNTPGERAKAATPVADLTARVDALESQLQTLTGQTEQNAYQLRELEKQFTAYKAEMDRRFPAEAAPEATPASLPVVPTVKPTPARGEGARPRKDARRNAGQGSVARRRAPRLGQEGRNPFDRQRTAGCL